MRIKMAVTSHSQSVLCLVTLLVLFIFMSAIGSSANSLHQSQSSLRKRRLRRQAPVYDLELTQRQVIAENAADDTVLYDLKSVTIDNRQASSFRHTVIENNDSKPPNADVFEISSNLELVFNDSISREDRLKKYFDYEQYPEVVVVIESVHNSDTSESDKKYIKLTIPLSDVNDELPVLKNQPFPYYASVPVNSREGDTVYILLAEDPDGTADLEYSINLDAVDPGNSIRSLFRMEEVRDSSGPAPVVQGHIRIAIGPNFRRGDKYMIPVRIRDKNGILPQEITADVDVLVGPRPPQFFQPSYEGSSFESKTTNNPVLAGSGSTDVLVIQVHQFQKNFPIVLRLLDDNNEESGQFRIDEEGKVYNIKSLEFDVPAKNLRPPIYKLHVKVVETSDDSSVLENTVPLTITVKDENDNPPQFQLTQYLHTIPEDTRQGTSVLSVLAEDNDSGNNAKLTYELENDFFRIETIERSGKTYGDIIVKSPLDYDAEPGPIYRFTVVAKDSGTHVLSSSVDVSITASNVNDEAPTIEDEDDLVLRSDVSVTGTYVLTRIRAKDDDGDGVKFYFSNPNAGNRLTRIEIFEINPLSGIIQVVKPVPSDINSYYVNVTAVDDGKCCGGTVSKTDEMSFVVEIVDSVNQKPTFDKCLDYNTEASVSEGKPAGSDIIQVKATDDGRGVNGIVEYSIESPDPGQVGAPFEINKETGKITVKNPVDREPNVNYIQITVKAADKAIPPQEGWCTFRIQVEDINDNPPVFNIEQYNEQIASNALPGRVALRVGASDKDIGDNAKITYTLTEDGGGVFGIIDDNGIIYVKTTFTAGRQVYDLIVKAEDNGTPVRSGTAQVRITLTAEEDTKPPKFIPDQDTYSYTIAENIAPKSDEAVIVTLECESNDPNEDRVQFFLVSESDGTLHARELGKFSIEAYKTTEGNFVDVAVSDDLDYETQRQHNIILRCQNFAALTMYEEKTLSVEVIDKNDNIPYFAGTLTTNGRYAGNVPENTFREFVVIDSIQAYDDDVSSEFKQLRFSLDPDSYDGVLDDFAIRPLPGNKASIVTKRDFDREVKFRYFLNVIVDDTAPSDISGGSPGSPNTASVIVQVIISDKNDNPMKFKQTMYQHTVPETANIGDLIFAVTADDMDEVDQGRLMYSFINVVEPPFDIRDQTGEIFVTSKLDFEKGPKNYRLTLESRDNLNLYTDTTEVMITVTDENDNVPVFKEYEYKIEGRVKEENTSITVNNPFPLVKVEATDADVSRKETRIRYHLLGKGTEPGPQQIFAINEMTGEIQLIATLDRDTNPEYIFTVEAEDEEVNPQKGYVNVKVFPIDINDNRPEFDRETLLDDVNEGIPEGSFITSVVANDIDAGRNAEIEYEIVNSPATTDASKTNYFRVDSGGKIYSQVGAEYLDRENVPEFKVVIRARDKGEEPLSSTATLTIKLNDINDNSPKFTEKDYNVLMSENIQSGIVKEVLATDDDINNNAALRYFLAPESATNGHFKIDYNNNKGYISIYKPVDYEVVEQRNLQIKIQVRDNSDDHIDEAVVNFTVEDFNDNAPVFEDSFKNVIIKEGNTPGENVTVFTATDIDSGINAQKSYQIERKSDPRREFYIDPNTGQVQTRKTLDREVAPNMLVLILAIDEGDPRQTGTATMSVIVEDINDNYPIFREDYRPVVDENQDDVRFPLFVEEIFAIDLDTPAFGPKFGFALPRPCTDIACEKFALKFEPEHDDGDGTAVITTSSVFDREEQKEYHLPIIMWDMRGTNSSESQTGTNTLTITIGDVNDNEPFPGHQNIFVYNYKGLFGSFVIGRVYVKDQDDWDLPDKVFTYHSPASLKSSFTVDTDTGDITMNKGVKPNFGGNPYQFSVSVYDQVFDKTVRSTVAVTVKELTEEAVMKSGSVRLSGITAAQFILEPENRNTRQKDDSLYTKFRVLMADKLGYPGIDNVEITTLRDGDSYLEVRYAAHGSPYLNPAEVDNVIIMNKAEFEDLGLSVQSIPVDECQDEIFEGGCYNQLTITGNPVTINSNGTSYVGVEAFLVATEGCQADVWPASNECSGDYCYNGGTCVKDAWGTLSCENCPSGYTGARCQERRHSFDGSSVAFYKTFLQCEESQTSIEFITIEEDGVLIYNGAMMNVDSQQNPQDFILLKLEGGYPMLMIDHGTGPLTLAIDGKDKTGRQLLQKLNDGEWHHLDINRNGKSVELVIDRCAIAEVNAPSYVVEDDRACRVQGETPGVNMYLNVNTLLQLGGVRLFETVSHLRGISLEGFKGCMRNLIHNKELYNLHYRSVEGMNTGKNGCPIEDAHCGITENKPKCGIHGRCEASIDGYITCYCHAGYYGNTCEKSTTIRDFDKVKQSYYYWKMKDELFNSNVMIENRELTAHIRFKTRQITGNLLYLYDPNSSPNLDIQLQLHDGKVRLSYNLGDGRKFLDLVNASANNGRWHTLTMERFGTEFHLRLDNGEGRNYVYTLGDKSGKESQVFRIRRHVYSGGYQENVNGRLLLRDDLKSTCIEDVRINNGYFAMTPEESREDDTFAEVVENPAVREKCRRDDDCLPDYCPGKICFPLWEDYECRCKRGFYEVSNGHCRSVCLPNPCYNNVTCTVPDGDIRCLCPPGWRGRLCDELNPEGASSGDLSSGALAAIVAAILIVILIVVVVIFLYRYCGRGDEGEKYILEVDPEDDIRENVMNYDEEGAGEEDQDAYDISRLQKPNFETSNRPYDPDKRRDVHRRDAAGDKPDVGLFIDDRLRDADDDDGAPPHDSVREFTFEGGESDAGSLSSLNTSSSDRSQDYDYLTDWGPKFAKLADMYGAGQDLET